MRFYNLGYTKEDTAYLNLDNVELVEVRLNEDRQERGLDCYFLKFTMVNGTIHFSKYMNYSAIKNELNILNQ